VVALAVGQQPGLARPSPIRTDLPQIVIPTTYAGSEATPFLGRPENGVKTTVTDPKVQPEVILYDAELVATLPVPMTVTSALNAMAHAAEALYAVNRNPVSTMLAIEGLKAFERALPKVIDNPQRSRCTGRNALWRLAMRHGAGAGWHGAASQALPHAGRVVRPAACRNACGRSAPCHRLQRPRGGRMNFSRSATFLAERMPVNRCTISRRQVGAPMALKDLGLKREAISTKLPIWPPATRTGIRNRWSARRSDNAAPSRLGRANHRSLTYRQQRFINHWEDDMITRRTLLKSTAAGLTPPQGGLAAPAIAQGARIKLGYVSPQSGPLAAFAEADNFILSNFARPRLLRTSRSSSRTASPTRTAPPKSPRS
jgi:hypothetical protein